MQPESWKKKKQKAKQGHKLSAAAEKPNWLNPLRDPNFRKRIVDRIPRLKVFDRCQTNVIVELDGPASLPTEHTYFPLATYYEDFIAGQSISTYPWSPLTKDRLGEPICDCYGCKLYDRRAIICVADGCNWGHRSLDAAVTARKAFMEMCHKHQVEATDTRELAALMLRAFSSAHDAITSTSDELYDSPSRKV